MKYRINFKSMMENDVIADVVYGEFDSLLEAAEQISKEATFVMDSDSGYFSHFNRQLLSEKEGDYKFGWFCGWEESELIADCRYYWICEASCPFSTYLEWNIVSV